MFLFTIIIVILGITFADDPFHPQYHIMPPANSLNDPNGPVYFNGYYHMFYQYYSNPVPASRKQWGHCYSKDMVHWIRLPVALVPDHPYDIKGVWTGSMTIVNGTPVIIYTGISNETKEVQCQARPTNVSDPTLTNWTKSSFNPMITSPGGRDPATVFQDNQNNYYLIYGCGSREGGDAVLFTSRDLENWTYLHPIHRNQYAGFWECPDIFNISNYTVLKASLLERDFWALGNLDPINVTFTPVNHDIGEYIQLIDHGKFYASKTFYDPLNRQQVIVGWASEEDGQGPQRGWQGLLTLPRAIFLTYDDGLEIRTRPIQELKTLRDPASHQQIDNITIPTPIPFRPLPSLRGNQIEVLLNWQFPINQNLDFGVCVLATPDGAQRTSVGIATRNDTNSMMNWDLPGWDYLSVPNITQWSDCQLICNRDNRCQSWTFDVSRPINGSCLLKSGIPLLISNPVSISGVKQRRNNQQPVWIYINRTLSQQRQSRASEPWYGVIWMSSSFSNNQISLGLDIFIDHSVIEVFEPQEGRMAITARIYPEKAEATYLGYYALQIPMNNASVVLKTLDLWNLETIWT